MFKFMQRPFLRLMHRALLVMTAHKVPQEREYVLSVTILLILHGQFTRLM